MFKDWGECVKGGIAGVATLDCLPTIFSNLLTALLLFVGTTALIIFIVGGFKLIHSGGDPKKLEGARNSFLYGILGLLIVLFSFAIMIIISHVTGVPCILNFGFECK